MKSIFDPGLNRNSNFIVHHRRITIQETPFLVGLLRASVDSLVDSLPTKLFFPFKIVHQKSTVKIKETQK
jgi:hypothetical protein